LAGFLGVADYANPIPILTQVSRVGAKTSCDLGED
jgi:hypothetical protein